VSPCTSVESEPPMPREYVYANHVTVRDGDLPAPPSPPVPPQLDVLRRRHQLLSSFVESLDTYGAELPNDVRSSVHVLRRRLDRLPLDRVPAASPGDDDEGGGEDGDTASTDVARRLQLRVVLSWEPGGREVTLGVDAEAPDGTPVNVGGLRASLDWHAANRLLGVTRVARDEANGAPE
jgi:hypothetical protein